MPSSDDYRCATQLSKEELGRRLEEIYKDQSEVVAGTLGKLDGPFRAHAQEIAQVLRDQSDAIRAELEAEYGPTKKEGLNLEELQADFRKRLQEIRTKYGL